MKCTKCQAENPDTYRFCTQCGANLEKVCPECSASNPLQYRFCSACGHELVVVPKPAPKDISPEDKLVAPGAKKKKAEIGADRGLKPFAGRERDLELLMDAEEYKAGCRDDISLGELNKTPKGYKGVKVKYRGETIRVMENGGLTDIIVDVTKDKEHWEGNILVWYDGTPEVTENDTILIWGEVRGNYTYTSAAGWKINLPLVRAKYVEVLQSAEPKS